MEYHQPTLPCIFEAQPEVCVSKNILPITLDTLAITITIFGINFGNPNFALQLKMRLHSDEAAVHPEHVGGCRGGGHPAGDGLDRLHRRARPGLPGPLRRPLRVAVPALQRPLVEPPARLLQGRLQDDVRHGPGALQEGRSKVG